MVTFGANIEHREGAKQREKDLDDAVGNSQENAFPENVVSAKKLYDAHQRREERQDQRQDRIIECRGNSRGPQKTAWQSGYTSTEDKLTTQELERQYRYRDYYPFIESQLEYGALEKELDVEILARHSAQSQVVELRMKANEAKEKLREKEAYIEMLETVVEVKDASATDRTRSYSEESIGSDCTVVDTDSKNSIATDDTLVASRKTEESAGSSARPSTSNEEQRPEAESDPNVATQVQ